MELAVGFCECVRNTEILNQILRLDLVCRRTRMDAASSFQPCLNDVMYVLVMQTQHVDT